METLLWIIYFISLGVLTFSAWVLAWLWFNRK